MSSVPWEPSITQTPRGSLLTTSPMSPYSEQPTGMEVNRKDHSHILIVPLFNQASQLRTNSYFQ
jgi:hypothetical protein